MKTIKSFFNSAFFWLFIITIAAFSLIVFTHDPVHRYVGTVVSVSSWDGSAKLRTKTETGKDTTLNVVNKKYERFEVGQTITVWTGGDLFDGIASTDPQH